MKLLLAVIAAGQTNPLLDMYAKETAAYAKDAEDAEKAAAMYTKMTEDALPGIKPAAVSLGAQEMNRVHVKDWAAAAWAFEVKLNDPRAARTGAAIGKATAPYAKAEGEYRKSQAAYDVTSQGYMLRAGGDSAQAKKLMALANQYHLEGKVALGDDYQTQAETLMKQAKGFADLAKSYTLMAKKIQQAIPSIQGSAGKAAAFAAYAENPTGDLPPKDLFPFTVVPPVSFLEMMPTAAPGPEAQPALRGAKR
jgi:hypothetical protein